MTPSLTFCTASRRRTVLFSPLRASLCTAKYQVSQSSAEYTTKEMFVVRGLDPLQLNTIIGFWGEGPLDSAFPTWTSLRRLLIALEDSTLNRHSGLSAGPPAWTGLWETSTTKTANSSSVIWTTNFIYQVRKYLSKTGRKATEKINTFSFPSRGFHDNKRKLTHTHKYISEEKSYFFILFTKWGSLCSLETIQY